MPKENRDPVSRTLIAGQVDTKRKGILWRLFARCFAEEKEKDLSTIEAGKSSSEPIAVEATKKVKAWLDESKGRLDDIVNTNESQENLKENLKQSLRDKKQTSKTTNPRKDQKPKAKGDKIARSNKHELPVSRGTEVLNVSVLDLHGISTALSSLNDKFKNVIPQEMKTDENSTKKQSPVDNWFTPIMCMHSR